MTPYSVDSINCVALVLLRRAPCRERVWRSKGHQIRTRTDLMPNTEGTVMISEVVAYAAATAQGTNYWRYCGGPRAGQMSAQGITQFYQWHRRSRRKGYCEQKYLVQLFDP